MNRDNLLKLIKQTVLNIEPTAEIILYGSRARGDAEPDSDWDLLILVDGEVDQKRDRRLGDELYEIELDQDVILSPMIYDRHLWNSDIYQVSPYRETVMLEGVRL